MTENRISRELNKRETAERIKTYAPAEMLPTPLPSEGYVFRWIRASMVGQLDPTNMSAKMREGWEPVLAEDHPELAYKADPNSRFKGNVEVGGLVLCKGTQEMALSRKAYYHAQNENQIAAVDNNFLRQSDSRMPIDALGKPIERKTSTSFGRGN